MQALGNKVIVELELLGKAHTRKSGIIMPDRKAGVPISGRVVSIGAKAEEKATFKVGDRVIFDEPRPVGFHHDGKKLLGLELEQIKATIPEGVEALPGKEL